MKLKELAILCKTNTDDLLKWLRTTNFKVKEGIFGTDIEDGQNINAIVEAFNNYRQQQQQKLNDENAAREIEREKQRKAEEEKRTAMANMLITSGFNFDGYTITRYSGYISGDDAVQIGRGKDGILSSATNVGSALMKSLVQIRRNALLELKEAAYDLGCNAIIGVDFDYLTLDPETANSSGGTTYLPYVFGVTANGNAVVIEKK